MEPSESTSLMDPKAASPAAFVLWNHVAHRRFLPTPSSHAFNYSTVSLLLDLDALESGRLDLGFCFRYGAVWPNLCGVRTQAYLGGGGEGRTQTIRGKLEKLLAGRGVVVGEVWMHTMPSLLGFEGINPLTVFYVYRPLSDEEEAQRPGPPRPPPELWGVVLEVHNTFGEQHVYVLETDDQEPTTRSAESGTTIYQWVFPRQFHVSPFNDRSGYYRCTINTLPPPSSFSSSAATAPPPKPTVKLDLLTHEETKRRKLVATISAVTSTPLTSTSLLSHLTRAPLALFLTFPRIAWQAFILHYFRRLDVYKKPEPMARDEETESMLGRDELNPTEENGEVKGFPMGYQSESFLERWARTRAERVFARRVEELKGAWAVRLITSNPEIAPRTIRWKGIQEDDRTSEEMLTIWYRSPRFFTILLLAPSPHHALLLGCDAEQLFMPSSREAFLAVSSSSSPPIYLAQRLRLFLVPRDLHFAPTAPNPLDSSGSAWSLLAVVALLVLMEKIERVVFWVLGARFVKGGEPWAGWERLNHSKEEGEGREIGSTRRKEAE